MKKKEIKRKLGREVEDDIFIAQLLMQEVIGMFSKEEC